MKKTSHRLLALICILCILCSSVLASSQASNQLMSYQADVRHIGSGELEILVSVQAVDTMDTLGASNIFVYQKIGSRWTAIDSVSSSYPGMTSKDTLFHDSYVYLDTVEDSYLKVEVVIYAKDYSGESDARVLTYYVYT